ncbi:hypothetical protein TOK_5099 [Pseudonocardia sp. N23]|nr:hypothetical protein TOK_5099 [Pseudonocardia sp. N23]
MAHPVRWRGRPGQVVRVGRFARSCRVTGHCALIAGSRPGGTGTRHGRDEEGSP